MITVNLPAGTFEALAAQVENRAQLTKAELKTLFYPSRKLRLIRCLTGPTNQNRTVKTQRSWGYEMSKDDGRVSNLRFETGDKVMAVMQGNGIGWHQITILNADGEISAQYELL